MTFLEHLWIHLNPYDAPLLEVRALYSLLREVYNPYWDGSEKQMDQMVGSAEKVIAEIKSF
jgi:hypothetical protein